MTVTTAMNLKLREVIRFLEVARLANRGCPRGPATGPVGNRTIAREAVRKVTEQHNRGAPLKAGASSTPIVVTTAMNPKPRGVIQVLEVAYLASQRFQCVPVQLQVACWDHLAGPVEGR